jgi:flagellar hook-associated protein 2
MGITINGPSGIDTASLTDQLVQLEQDTKITPITNQKTQYQVQIDAYTKLKSYVTDIGAKANDLNSLSSFNLYKQTSSNQDIVTLTGATGGAEGSYSIKVFQTARQEKLISADGRITSQTAMLASQGISTGAITVDGVSIQVDADDTIQDLRSKINAAQKADGSKLGVTASVMKVSDSNFRLVLTARDTGKDGAAYSGQPLVDLGILADAAGGKGSAAQTATSTGDIASAFAALAPGQVIEYSGLDHNGNTVSNTFIKEAGSTIDDFIQQVKDTFFGMADVSIESGTGRLIISDAQTGTSRLSLSSFTMGGAAQQMQVNTVGKNGAGVLVSGANAYFSVDGMTLESKSNTAEGFISGVTLNLHKASTAESVAVSITRDYDAIEAKAQKLVDAFNALVKYQKETTAYADPNDKTRKKGDLAGDMTVNSIVTQFRQLFQKQFNLFPGTYSGMLSLGIKTDYTTGQLTVDKDALEKALETDLDGVMKTFVTTGLADNPGVMYGMSTSDTASGKYDLQETADGQQLQARLSGASDWFTSDVRQGDVVGFSSGALKGLMLTSPQGAVPAGSPATFTFQKGLGSLLKELSDKMNDTDSGVIALHQTSLRKSIEYADTRITTFTDQIARYKERLIKQFANMEQQMSSLKAQYNRMASALGLSSSS